jgi:hypothetical protein
MLHDVKATFMDSYTVVFKDNGEQLNLIIQYVDGVRKDKDIPTQLKELGHTGRPHLVIAR